MFEFNQTELKYVRVTFYQEWTEFELLFTGSESSSNFLISKFDSVPAKMKSVRKV